MAKFDTRTNHPNSVPSVKKADARLNDVKGSISTAQNATPTRDASQGPDDVKGSVSASTAAEKA